jgi:hypothetical protein
MCLLMLTLMILLWATIRGILFLVVSARSDILHHAVTKHDSVSHKKTSFTHSGQGKDFGWCLSKCFLLLHTLGMTYA